MNVTWEEPWAEFYIGEWKNDMKHGKGKFLYSNGDIYDGEWINDKKDGLGKMIYNDGSIQNGIWEKDVLIKH